MDDSMLCSQGALHSWLRKKFMKFLPLKNRLEAESSSDGEEKQMSDWTTGTDGTDDLDTEWYSGN